MRRIKLLSLVFAFVMLVNAFAVPAANSETLEPIETKELTVGKPYSEVLWDNEDPASTVQISAGSLPDGLALTRSFSNGTYYYIVSGTPTEAGHYVVRFEIIPNGLMSSSVVLAYDVSRGNIDVLTAALPDGTVGEPYSAKIETNYPDDIIQFTEWIDPQDEECVYISSVGLALSGNGDVSGTPTKAGDYKFMFYVFSDEAPSETYGTVTIHISEPEPATPEPTPEPTICRTAPFPRIRTFTIFPIKNSTSCSFPASERELSTAVSTAGCRTAWRSNTMKRTASFCCAARSRNSIRRA